LGDGRVRDGEWRLAGVRGRSVHAHDRPNYHGAFVHDPAGHDIEAFCHDPEDHS
jgi:hypothetical protein